MGDGEDELGIGRAQVAEQDTSEACHVRINADKSWATDLGWTSREVLHVGPLTAPEYMLLLPS